MQPSSCRRCGRFHGRYADPEKLDLLRSTQYNETLRQQNECLAYGIEQDSLLPPAVPEHASVEFAFRPVTCVREEERPGLNLTEAQIHHQQSVVGPQHQMSTIPNFQSGQASPFNYTPFSGGPADAQYSYMTTAATLESSRCKMNEAALRRRISAAPEPDENMVSMAKTNEITQCRDGTLDGEEQSSARTSAGQRRPRSPELGNETGRRDKRVTRTNDRMGQLRASTMNRRGVTPRYTQRPDGTMVRQTSVMMPELHAGCPQRKNAQIEALLDKFRTIEAQYELDKEEYAARWIDYIERKTSGKPVCSHRRLSLDRQRQRLADSYRTKKDVGRKLQDLHVFPVATRPRLEPTEQQQKLEEAKESEKSKKEHEAASNEPVVVKGLLALNTNSKGKRIHQHKVAELILDRPFKIATKEYRTRQNRRRSIFQNLQRDQCKEAARIALEEEAYRLKMVGRGSGAWPRFPKWKEEWSTVYQVTRFSSDAEPHRRTRFENEGMWFV